MAARPNKPNASSTSKAEVALSGTALAIVSRRVVAGTGKDDPDVP